MKRVILESPYRGTTAFNTEYARICLKQCLFKGEAPLASHLLYTQPGVLRDDVALDRGMGIRANMEWIPVADALVVYTDLGISDGMSQAIDYAKSIKIPVVMRSLFGRGTNI